MISLTITIAAPTGDGPIAIALGRPASMDRKNFLTARFVENNHWRKEGLLLWVAFVFGQFAEVSMWYLAMRRPVKPRQEWTVSLDQHLVWMKQQHEAGTILFSGPTPDRKFGIYVIRAASKADAEKVAAADPYTAAGFCAFDLYEWEVHQIMGAGPFTAKELQAHR
jgi:uncharacterized protein YciI